MSSSKSFITDSKCLILGGLEYRLSNENFASFRETFIFAHDCSATVSQVRAQDFHLHTNSFSYPQGFRITTDGVAGNAATATTAAVQARAASGVWLSFEFVRPHFPFSITAKGGDGYEGIDAVATHGTGGNGGNGGAGGKVTMIYNDLFRNILRASRQVNEAKTPRERKLRLQGWLKSSRNQLVNTPSHKHIEDGLKALENLIAGSATADEDIEKEFSALKDDLDGSSSKFRASISIDVRGGAYGTGGDGSQKGNNGVSGPSGSLNSTLMTPKSVANSTEILVHPDQISIAVLELENLFFIGTSSAILTAIRHVQTLKQRLSFIDQLTPQDPLFKAYVDNESHLLIVPSGEEMPTSIASLKVSLENVRAIERNLYGGYDFYGHVASWVPSGSFPFYRDQLNSALNDLISIQNNYFKYQDIAREENKAKDRISYARAAVDVGKRSCKADLVTLRSQLKSSASSIAVLQEGLPTKRKALVEKIRAFSQDIKNSFNISMESFVNAASTFVFAPGLAMGAVQAASLLHTGLSTITDDAGIQIRKEFVVNKITVMSAGLEGLKEAIEAGNGGELTVDDPGAAKLMAKESDIQDLLTKYRETLGSEKVRVVREMFDDYLKVVIDRNNLVIHYNACLVLWLTTKSKLDSYVQTERSLGRDFIERVHGEVPQLAVTVERNYITTISTVMELLYRTTKALSYVTLSVEPTTFTRLRGQGFLQEGIATALKEEKIDIIKRWANAIEGSKALRQPFGGDNDAVKYELTEEQLQSLLLDLGGKDADYGVIMGIPAARKRTPVDESPFAGYADVRLTRVRFYLDGVQTASNKLQVTLLHGGTDEMVAPDDLSLKFTHDSSTIKFHYDIITGRIITDGNVEDAVDHIYALPGPFTSWRISISKKYNQGLDLSNVSSAWFEFSGLSRSFL
ncbi:hypothetical protein ACKRZS_009882 [Fusarium odoratissimum]|uniref:Uncharacterized protein n=1 Tax=Fusarium odoratissimum (strain NRRL 54006) TaxID=1089451 RepID=X0LJQ7_FUSO5|nr:uncharacterized protein FOIG_01889 [Fusarium odoratissimum NRRL 54006]EXM08840.1 hypothetical protein FOIG_01889 [Fusarium odoratissimum NRRL 54006]KAK2127970.1 hypothetical protein NOF04DRAFT_8344 [Fusarium oxysporum II5]